MSAVLLAGLLFAQASSITVEARREEADVGYHELIAGRPTAALEKIETNRAIEFDDPAALINRGTAQARLGDLSGAQASYRAALISRQRYPLELHDGTWLDSRRAARLAIRMLSQGETLALR